MSDTTDDAFLEARLRAADPLTPGSLPSETDTEEALHRLLVGGPPPRRVPRAPHRAPRWRRSGMLAGTSAGLAALATALALLLGATASPPAFAVTRNPNGTVTIRLVRLSGIAGANRKLAAMGVSARILPAMAMARYVAATQPCLGKGPGTVQTLTVNPGKIPPRQVLLLAADRAAHLGYYAAASKLRTAARTGAAPPPATGNTGTKFHSIHTQVLVPARIRNALVAKARALAGTPPKPGFAGNRGNSSNSRSSGNSGNSGNSGTVGNSGAGPWTVYCGGSGSNGSSGKSGGSGNS